ncbi:peptidoglycan DD-metalloendopeptidase family protein [Wenyingzhuangia sp. IMCC45533]
MVILQVSCKEPYQTVKDFITNPSDKELYVRSFKQDTILVKKWEESYKRAKQDSVTYNLPYTEYLYTKDSSTIATSFVFTFKEGSLGKIAVNSIKNTAVFLDIYKNDKQIEELLFDSQSSSFLLKKPGTYHLILQPKINQELSFVFTCETMPKYQFPVAGYTPKAVQSFWGAPRAGGRRKHKGVDIFAKRGTPVVAATGGFISNTGNRGLGGKQVWLKDGLLGNSLYYAHLDSIDARTGSVVKVGDTLGFVGNTGNARTTPPHLHFGIYKSTGAIDPFPFIKTYPKARNTQQNAHTYKEYRIKRIANLRKGPSKRYAKILSLNKTDDLKVIGKSEKWFRVQLRDGTQGFVYESLLTPASN